MSGYRFDILIVLVLSHSRISSSGMPALTHRRVAEFLFWTSCHLAFDWISFSSRGYTWWESVILSLNFCPVPTFLPFFLALALFEASGISFDSSSNSSSCYDWAAAACTASSILNTRKSKSRVQDPKLWEYPDPTRIRETSKKIKRYENKHHDFSFINWHHCHNYTMSCGHW